MDRNRVWLNLSICTDQVASEVSIIVSITWPYWHFYVAKRFYVAIKLATAVYDATWPVVWSCVKLLVVRSCKTRYSGLGQWLLNHSKANIRPMVTNSTSNLYNIQKKSYENKNAKKYLFISYKMWLLPNGNKPIRLEKDRSIRCWERLYYKLRKGLQHYWWCGIPLIWFGLYHIPYMIYGLWYRLYNTLTTRNSFLS